MSNQSLTGPGAQMASALDPHRRRAFRRAIRGALSELSSSEGAPRVALLGWQAATLLEVFEDFEARIWIVESAPEMVASIEAGVSAHDLGGSVHLVEAAPAEVELDEEVDLAIYVGSSTWFLDGADAAVLQHARNELLAEGGQLIPRRLVHLFELAHLPNEVGGMPMRRARFSRPGEPIAVMSESKHFLTTDLSAPLEIPETIDDTLFVRPLLGGIVSGLRLRTLVELTEGVVEVSSFGGIQSILVPLREDLVVEERQPINLHIQYPVGAGLGEASFSGRVRHEAEPSSEDWDLVDHEITERFRERVAEMVERVDRAGRGEDLDKVVGYTIEPHGDVSRLTALHWTVDEDFQKPLRELVEGFRNEAAALGATPSDEVIYELMLDVYREVREED